MIKRRDKWLALVLAAAMALSLMACGGSRAQEGARKAARQERKLRRLQQKAVRPRW